MQWDDEVLTKIQKVLSKDPKGYHHALQVIEAEFGVSADAVRRKFQRAGMGHPREWADKKKGASEATPKETPSKGVKGDPRLERLAKVAGKNGISLEELCNQLDLSPHKTRALVEDARNQGINIRVEGNLIGVREADPISHVVESGIAPTGDLQKVAVISDTHLGSKYCMRGALKDFIHNAYAEGVREILHPGDIVDGDYRHAKFEMSHMGLDDQAQDLFDTLPRLPGLTYHAITGNHDGTFADASGINVGGYLEGYFSKRGRHDLRVYGNRGAFIRIRGAVVHLWHPRSGTSYARSHQIQKLIEKYSSGEKPHILLAGHWHIFCHILERGVHGIACPTFQGGGSAFSRSLGGAPAIGGLMLSWRLTREGTMRDFSLGYRSYYEVEKPYTIQADAYPGNGGDRTILEGLA